MTDDSEIAGLLQALEHELDAVDRLSAVVQQFIDAQQGGGPLSTATVAEYARQLQTVSTDRERMRQLLAGWWQMLGQEGAQ